MFIGEHDKKPRGQYADQRHSLKFDPATNHLSLCWTPSKVKSDWSADQILSYTIGRRIVLAAFCLVLWYYDMKESHINVKHNFFFLNIKAY